METLTLRPGDIPDMGSLFVTAKWDGLRLSLTGVVGPGRSGSCRGSCGQCSSELDEITDFADGWTRESVDRLKSIWER